MSETKLLPCPFCGGEATIDREDIFCDNCYLSMKIFSRVHNGDAETYDEARTQAINDWNTRKPMDNIVEQLEERKNDSLQLWKQYQLKDDFGKMFAFDESIKIVRKGGIE